MSVAEIGNIISSVKVLVVGAGGIGCELLKNLVLSGFKDIVIVDLDTIDVSNLNRQFLFKKIHVGKSKAIVAKESAEKLRPSAKIIAHHDSITNPNYDVEFFKSFAVVLNALDNIAARSHVNRMCLAADVPLIESGTAGYLGNVSVIKKGVTQCYECIQKLGQKTYPGCTIRNTPSELIHCVVWSKHLYNQLFGEEDPDEDVSPDTADPELGGDEHGKNALQNENNKGEVERKSTRAWAVSTSYDPVKLFNKLFSDDIKYLLSMDKLWQKRRPPTPLNWNNLPDAVASSSAGDSNNSGLRDQQLWSVQECADVFEKSIMNLKNKLTSLKAGDHLVWDKDDDDDMDFVTACANIRAHCFGIQQKSRFNIKSMAGNIIPAIATTNAVIAGIIVLQAFKILRGKTDACSMVYLNKQVNYKRKIIINSPLDPPNPKCYVCSAKPEATVHLNVNTLTVKTLEEKVLKGALNMIAPDVEIEGKGVIMISSEEGETESNNDKFLSGFGIRNGTRLVCDDFLQNFNLVVIIAHSEKLPDGVEFRVFGDVKPEETEKNDSDLKNGNSKLEAADAVHSDDDLEIVEMDSYVEDSKKRKLETPSDQPEKRARRSSPDIVML